MSSGARSNLTEKINAGRRGSHLSGKIEASMDRAFSENRRFRGRTLLREDELGAQRNRFPKGPSQSSLQPQFRESLSGPPSRPSSQESIGGILKIIDKKVTENSKHTESLSLGQDSLGRQLDFLTQENAKLSLGQAALGRQMEVLLAAFQGGGDLKHNISVDERIASVAGGRQGGSDATANFFSPIHTPPPAQATKADETTAGNENAEINEDENTFGSDEPIQVRRGNSTAERLFGGTSSPTSNPLSEAVEESDSEEDSDDEGKFRAINQFRLVDKDGSGSLDLNEVLAGAKILGLKKDEAKELYDGMEKNEDGEVQMDDYLAAYQLHNGHRRHNTLPPVVIHNEIGEYMINPRSNFRLTWDLGVMMPFLLYLTVVLPFRLTFVNEASIDSWVFWLELMIDLLFLVDMGLSFHTGIIVETRNSKGEAIEAVEYDKKIVATSYIKSWFFIDLFSGVPFSLIDLVSNGGSPKNAKSLKALRFLKLARLLKLGRLLKIEKILYSLDRDTLDRIEDFFTDGASLSFNSLVSLLLALGFIVHLMACLFVVAGRASDDAGQESWLHYEIKGPFTSQDTTGLNGDDPVYSIYIASYYFCLTTMTSVGYGDILPRSNSERIFVIFLEFASSIVFATIIGLITAVVTSLDLGAKKKAEGLAEVSAFISFRRFPRKLGRRIRRHFRKFYSLKTAMDEKKIFSDLSTTLRKDVSEFLVLDLMGSESFFMTMSTTLWPRLLPLLQPVAMEANERLCKQGEECEEMFVIINGVMTGTTHLEGSNPERDPPKVERRLTKGDSVNVLCLLEIWYKCVETVVSGLNTVETYAVKSEEFVALFQSDMDVKNFNSMQRREVKKFHFEPSEDAPTSLGMPLYMSCFASIEVKLAKVVGPILHSDVLLASRTLAWVAVDLVDNKTDKAFNEFWNHATEPTSPQVTKDGSLHLFCGGQGHFMWSDVSASFKNASLRFRVYLCDPAVGMENLVATSYVPLQNLYKNMPKRRPEGGATQAPSESARNDYSDLEPPLEEDEVVVWCELQPKSGKGALSYVADPEARLSQIHYGEVLARSPSLSALKVIARVKKPEKHKKPDKRPSGLSQGGGEPSSHSPPHALENDHSTFQGTRASGRKVLDRMTSQVLSDSVGEDQKLDV